ncbi:Dolichyl-diphosphooligosaccharide--protein glycosyltransferase subunit 1A [Platanthera guangdongensis]|uniref:Dolichyl-diphosphooligosaccharide--protein glycosyltransferase subunit 1A n=1 Tax=Platanthera guangdongensis TaxID=2320717 RepID=A0ABR2LR69_9ASPA
MPKNSRERERQRLHSWLSSMGSSMEKTIQPPPWEKGHQLLAGEEESGTCDGICTVQQVQNIIIRCLSTHEKLETSLQDLSRTGDVQSCKATRKVADGLLKELSKELKPLMVFLQSSPQAAQIWPKRINSFVSLASNSCAERKNRVSKKKKQVTGGSLNHWPWQSLDVELKLSGRRRAAAIVAEMAVDTVRGGIADAETARRAALLVQCQSREEPGQLIKRVPNEPGKVINRTATKRFSLKCGAMQCGLSVWCGFRFPRTPLVWFGVSPPSFGANATEQMAAYGVCTRNKEETVPIRSV